MSDCISCSVDEYCSLPRAGESLSTFLMVLRLQVCFSNRSGLILWDESKQISEYLLLMTVSLASPSVAPFHEHAGRYVDDLSSKLVRVTSTVRR